jgi:hypothetical protein
MDFEKIKAIVGTGSADGNILAEVIISTYWHNKRTSLFSLTNLDKNSRKFAYKIMEYRLSKCRDDEKFHELALYAKNSLCPPYHLELPPPLKPVPLPKIKKP